jgi:hypothetical protein
MGRGEVRAGFWWVNPREGDHLEDADIDGMILKWSEMGAWTESNWLRIRTGDGDL